MMKYEIYRCEMGYVISDRQLGPSVQPAQFAFSTLDEAIAFIRHMMGGAE